MIRTNPTVWRGLKYPDSDLVGLVYRFARPGRDVPGDAPFALDVGCGPGRHVRLLSEIGYRAVGIDADPEMCACCRANGVQAVLADAGAYQPPEPPGLALCWGFMMLVLAGPELIARWRPQVVIADWRTPENSCFHWPDNEALIDRPGWVRFHNPGHTLDGEIYRSHELADCVIPGYDRVHWQQITRTTDGERNDWYQTVHRRR